MSRVAQGNRPYRGCKARVDCWPGDGALSGKNTLLLFGASVALGLSLTAVTFPSAYENVLLVSLGALLAFTAAWCAFHKPALVIFAVVFFGIFAPFSVSTGTKTKLPISLLLVATLNASCLLRLAAARKKGISLSPRMVWPLLLLLFFSVCSFSLAQFSGLPANPAPIMAQLAGLGIFLLSGGIFFVSALELRTELWLRRVTYGFLAAGAVQILLLLMPVRPLDTWASRFGASAGSLFWTWLIPLSFAQAWLNDRLSILARLAFAALSVTAICFAFFKNSAWASGWVPAMVAIFVITAVRTPIKALAFGGTLAVASLWLIDDIVNLLWTAEQQYSVVTRIEAAKVLTQIVKVNPLFGLGPSNYYHYTSQYPILGWYVPFSSHNNYVDVLLQTGMFGLFSLIWFLGEVGRAAMRLRKRVDSGFMRAFVHGAIGGFAGTLCASALGDWLLPFVYNVGLAGFSTSVLAWVFLGGLVGVGEVATEMGRPWEADVGAPPGRAMRERLPLAPGS